MEYPVWLDVTSSSSMEWKRGDAYEGQRRLNKTSFDNYFITIICHFGVNYKIRKASKSTGLV